MKHFINFLFLLFVMPAQAQLTTGPVASSMGGAGRAAIDPGEVALLNAAALAHLRQYFGSANFGISEHPREGDVRRFGVVVADATPGTLLPGALSYQNRKTTPRAGSAVVEQDIQVAFGFSVLPELALGISAHHLISSPDGGSDVKQTNGHLGLLFTPADWVGLSFNIYDLLPADNAITPGLRVIPTFALGSHVMLYEIIRLRLDLVRPDKENPGRRTDVMAGVETLFRNDFAFRFGTQWRETADQLYLTAGLGYRGPKLNASYSYQRDMRSDDGVRHMIDIWLPF